MDLQEPAGKKAEDIVCFANICSFKFLQLSGVLLPHFVHLYSRILLRLIMLVVGGNYFIYTPLL